MAEDAEVKIKIGGDAKGAVGALNAVKTGLNAVKTGLNAVKAGIGQVMMAMGVVGFAIEGFRKIVEGLKALDAWMRRAARTAAEARIATAFKSAAQALSDLNRQHANRLSQLREELSLMRFMKELADIDRGGREEAETARREASRAQEMAGVTDPRRQMEIRQRWRVEDERRERERNAANAGERADAAEGQASAYGNKAREAREAARKAGEELENIFSTLGKLTSEESKKEAQRQIEALKARRNALEESAKAWQEEALQASLRAAAYRRRREELRRMPSVAERQNSAETAEFEREEAKKSEERRRGSKEAAAAFVQAHVDSSIKDAGSRLSQTESFQGRFLAAAENSGNRLTAMGLGGGVATSPVVAKIGSDLVRVIEMQKKEIEELKSFRPNAGSAGFGLVLEP